MSLLLVEVYFIYLSKVIKFELIVTIF